MRSGYCFAGWLLGSFFLGGYGPDGQGMNGVSGAATAAIKSWAVGVPVRLSQLALRF